MKTSNFQPFSSVFWCLQVLLIDSNIGFKMALSTAGHGPSNVQHTFPNIAWVSQWDSWMLGQHWSSPASFKKFQWMFKPFISANHSKSKFTVNTFEIKEFNTKCLWRQLKLITIITIVCDYSVVMTFGAKNLGGLPLICGRFSSPMISRE